MSAHPITLHLQNCGYKLQSIGVMEYKGIYVEFLNVRTGTTHREFSKQCIEKALESMVRKLSIVLK